MAQVMTLGKSSSADSEGPVPFDAVLGAVEECCRDLEHPRMSTMHMHMQT